MFILICFGSPFNLQIYHIYFFIWIKIFKMTVSLFLRSNNFFQIGRNHFSSNVWFENMNILKWMYLDFFGWKWIFSKISTIIKEINSQICFNTHIYQESSSEMKIRKGKWIKTNWVPMDKTNHIPIRCWSPLKMAIQNNHFLTFTIGYKWFEPIGVAIKVSDNSHIVKK